MTMTRDRAVDKLPLGKMLLRFCDDTGRDLKTIIRTMKRPMEVMFGTGCLQKDVRKHFCIEGAKRASHKIRTAGYCREVQAKIKTLYNKMWEWLSGSMLINAPYNKYVFKVEPKISKVPIAFTPEEVQALFRAAETCPYWTDIKRKRILSMLVLTYYTGARIKHLLEARRSDFNPDTGVLRIVNTKSFREQIFHLPPEISKVVDEGMARHKSHPRYNYVIVVKDYMKAFYHAKKLAGLDMMNRMRFHGLRKSCATHITSAVGVEAAAKHLGHHDQRTTIAKYIDPRQVSLETFCQVLDVSILVNSQAPPPGSEDK